MHQYILSILSKSCLSQRHIQYQNALYEAYTDSEIKLYHLIQYMPFNYDIIFAFCDSVVELF